ncbi:hypothetical protein [Flavobacterium aestuarii]|uniref:hypothetical protein n=1 Tax=Flavobacterium aestuarii TaxID=3149227 RepID=UPI0032B4A240
MKRIQNYSLKTAILFIVIGSMAFLYWYGFYKQFDQEYIPDNADGVAIVDIKNIRNHFVFSFLKNPSQWGGRKGSETRNSFSFSSCGLQTPDFLSFFHIQNQPLNQWCFAAKIENEAKFNKALIDLHFVKNNVRNPFSSYYSKIRKVNIIRYGNQVLYCTNTPKEQKSSVRIAEDLFIKKNCFDSRKIEKAIKNPNAVTIWIEKNYLLTEDAIITIALKEDEITAQGQLKLKPEFRKTASFIQNPDALLSLGINFGMIREHYAITHDKAKISKIIGFNVDSILMYRPAKTELVLHNIIEKKDTAITTDYDDDFNPIKKTVVHSIREPSFYFSMQTDNSRKIYDYLKNQNAIDGHQVFVNFPFAKTRAFAKNNFFILEANSPKYPVSKSFSPEIGFLQINFSKIQNNDWNYMIAKNKNLKFLKSFKTFGMYLTEENNTALFRANLKAKEGKRLIEIME